MTIIWCMVPEIWSTTDRTFCHSGPFLALLPPSSPPPAYTLMDPENQNFEKVNKVPGYIIILHKCTVNDNHMMYIWFLRYWVWQPWFLSFWTVFCPFNPLTTQKINILKNWKKLVETLSFYTCVPQMTIIWCMDPGIVTMTKRFFCHFGLFFALLPP